MVLPSGALLSVLRGSYKAYAAALVLPCTVQHADHLMLVVCWALGGFAGKECYVETEGTLKVLDFYPEDSNKLQYFYLKERVNVKKIRSVFF
jgi:hypothetical protein